jgi:hypothetical protein
LDVGALLAAARFERFERPQGMPLQEAHGDPRVTISNQF